MHCVTSLIHKAGLSLSLVLGVCFGTGALAQTSDDSVSLSLPQAREVAAYALKNDQPELALRLSSGLVRADPRDGVAHYMMALAYARLNEPAKGRKAAARAYRFSEPGPDRLGAAQLAARLAYEESRPTLAQIWLRRTAIHAQTERDERLLARDYQALRQQNPFSFSIRTDIRPSNNVNNGADSTLNIINGIPDQGFIPASSQALPGVIASVDTSLGYTLRVNENSRTTLAGRLYLSRVRLSEGDKAKAGVSNSDYASTYSELSLSHGFRAGQGKQAGTAGVEFAFGESRYGGQRNFLLARVSGHRKWKLSRSTSVQVNLLAERRYQARVISNNTDIFGMGTSFNRRLANGDRLGLSMTLRDSDAEFMNGTYQSVSLRTTYSFGKRWGPARVTAGLGLGYSDYPLVRAGYDPLRIPIDVPRDDKSVHGDVTFFFEDFDYAGFAPTLRLRAGRNKSNISAYSTREFSISLGVASKF